MVTRPNRRRRRLLPKPPKPPSGYIYFYWELVPIAEVDAHAKRIMKGFDQLPRRRRDKLNRDGL
jgi:hypothetical protein